MCRPRAPLLDEPQPQTRHPSRFYCFGRSINRNVAWTWAAVLAQGLADSIWAGTVLVKFLNELLGNNAYVGYIEAASGAAIAANRLAKFCAMSPTAPQGGAVGSEGAPQSRLYVTHGSHAATSPRSEWTKRQIYGGGWDDTAHYDMVPHNPRNLP